MQIQEGAKSKSMGGVIAEMYRTGGIRSIFKGTVATLARDGPGSALYFATYEYVKKELSAPGEDLSFVCYYNCWWLCRYCYVVGCFPNRYYQIHSTILQRQSFHLTSYQEYLC